MDMGVKLRLATGLTAAETFARDIFLEDPDLSIDTAARLIHDHCERSLSKDVVSKIRHQVRQAIGDALPAGQTEPEETDGFANHPRLVEDKMKTEIKKGRANVDTETKRRFLGDWAMANPLSTIREAREALRKEFGETLGTSYIADTLKAARNLVMEEKRRLAGETHPAERPAFTPQQPLRESAREIAAAMKSSGIKSLRINEDDTIDFEVAALSLN